MGWATFAAAAIPAVMGMMNKGKGDKLKKIPTMTPGQEKLLQGLINQLGMQGGLGQGYGQSVNYLTDLMNPNSEAVRQFTEPYMQQFEQQTVPGLAERFAGAGAMGGGLSSSGFGQSLSAAGGQLQNQLAALKAGLGQQAAGQLMSQYGGLMGQALGAQPFAYMKPQMSGQQGFMQGYANAGFPGLQQGLSWLGNAWGNSGPIMGNV